MLKKILEKLEGLSNLRLSVKLHCRSITVVTLETRKNTLQYIGAKFAMMVLKESRVINRGGEWNHYRFVMALAHCLLSILR